MPTVIDSLVISLGLDPSNFTKGRKQAENDFRATRDTAVTTAKELESRGKQAAQFYSKIRNEVLALGAAFFGARGIEEFTRRMTAADTATGLLAKNLGTSTESLSTWEGVARRSGVSAADAATSMQNLVSQFQQFAVTGQGGAFIPYFQQLGISITDAQGKLKSMDDLFMEIAGSEEWQKMTGPERQVFGAGLGLTPGMVNVLSQPLDEIRQKLADAKRDAVTFADSETAKKLQTSWEGVRLAFDSLGRTILTDVTPPLSDLLLELREFVEANKEEIGENFREFAEWLKTVDWKAVEADIKSFAHGAEDAYKAVGGWVTITEILFGLWLGPKFVAVLANLLSIGTAIKVMGGGAAAVEAAGAGEAAVAAVAGVGALATVGAVAAITAGALVAHPTVLNADEDPDWRKIAQPPPGTPLGDSVAFPRTGGAKTPTSARKPQTANVDSDIAYFVAQGWSREQAAGIVANLQAESSGNTGATGDNGQAYGLAQWHPDRQAAFAKWAGHDIRQSTRAEQLGFVNYELSQGSKKDVGAALRRESTAAGSAELVSRRYEVPAAAAAEAAKRAQLAAALVPPTPDKSLLAGARAGATASGGAGATTNTSKTDVTIGTITVNTSATDADGIAKDIASAMQKHTAIPQLNQGLS